MVKTMDLVGFTLMSGRDTSTNIEPSNRKFQDSLKSPNFLPGCDHLGMWTKAYPEDDLANDYE